MDRCVTATEYVPRQVAKIWIHPRQSCLASLGQPTGQGVKIRHPCPHNPRARPNRANRRRRNQQPPKSRHRAGLLRRLSRYFQARKKSPTFLRRGQPKSPRFLSQEPPRPRLKFQHCALSARARPIARKWLLAKRRFNSCTAQITNWMKMAMGFLARRHCASSSALGRDQYPDCRGQASLLRQGVRWQGLPPDGDDPANHLGVCRQVWQAIRPAFRI